MIKLNSEKQKKLRFMKIFLVDMTTGVVDLSGRIQFEAETEKVLFILKKLYKKIKQT
jgi:hypothetical protein